MRSAECGVRNALGESESAVRSRDAALEEELAEAMAAAAEQATGLTVRIGIADGKFAAYVAAVLNAECGVRNAEWNGADRVRTPHSTRRTSEGEGAPSAFRTPHSALRTYIVPPGAGAAFVAALPVDDLPVSTEMRRRLRLFGLRTLGDLARLPQGAVTAQFGSEGARAWELAHGIDRAPLVPYRAPVAVVERLALPAPVDALEVLLAAVKTLLRRAVDRPQTRGRAARSVQLRVHLEDGHTWEREVTFREPVARAERMLLALQQKVEGATLPAPFTEVELTLLDLCGESALQGNLFISQQGLQLERVAEAARQLKVRYGRPVLARVMEVEPWSRIPERRFALIDYDP